MYYRYPIRSSSMSGGIQRGLPISALATADAALAGDCLRYTNISHYSFLPFVIIIGIRNMHAAIQIVSGHPMRESLGSLSA